MLVAPLSSPFLHVPHNAIRAIRGQPIEQPAVEAPEKERYRVTQDLVMYEPMMVLEQQGDAAEK